MAPTFTDTQVISQIDSGRSWSGSTITFGFLQSAPSWDIGYEGDGFSPFTSYQAAATRVALLHWDDLIAPPIVEQTSSQEYANVKFGNTTTAINYAHAYYPGTYSWAGEVWLNSATYTGLYNPDPGDYYFMTILHEIGHALGLSHPGNYNGGSPTYANDAVYAQDTHQWTVMSYFSASNTGADWNGGGGWQYAQTPMVHDILTIQSIYGADTTTRTGNTTYGFNSTADRDVFNFAGNSSPVLTIYDAGGIDTLDLSGFAQRAVVNLEPGTYTSAGGTTSTMTYNIGIAHNTWIENAFGGSGSDVIYGNAADNELRGNGGDDQLHGLNGNDQLKGGSGTDWAYFTSSISSYAFGFSSSYIQVIGTFVDTVWNDVEWFSFADGSKSYSEIVAIYGTQEVETSGDYDLVIKAGEYRAIASDSSEVALTYGGQPVGPNSFGGWTAIHVEESASGGFEVLWAYEGGSYGWWQMDASGAYQSSWLLGPALLPYLETGFQADLNNDTVISPGSIDEANGNLALVTVGGQHQAVASDGSAVALTYGGNPISPTGIAGQTAVQVDYNAIGGLSVLWAYGGGGHAIWNLEADGAYESSWLVGSGLLPYFEGGFGADLNGDGQVWSSWVKEANGDVTLVDFGGQYRAVTGSGAAVTLSYGGQPVGPASFGGWQAIQVEESAAGGYEVLWAYEGGSYGWWQTDASGAYQSSWLLGPALLPYLETGFQADLNNNGVISAGSIAEANGSHALVTVGGQYQAVASDGSAVVLNHGGNPIGPASIAGQTAVQVDQSPTGGLALLWAYDGGSHALWYTDAAGAYESSLLVGSGLLPYFEGGFAADLNQDGQISTASVIEANGDVLLVTDGGHYKAVASDGSAVTLTYGGQPVGPESFGGWDAIQVEESASGGFEFLWAYEGGSYGWWTTDATGAYESSMLIGPDDLIYFEKTFGLDLNKDGLNSNDWFIEANGQTALAVVGDQYRAIAGDGSAVALTDGSNPIGPDSIAGQTAVQVEESASGGFALLWAYDGGSHALWYTDAAGAYESSLLVGSGLLPYFEGEFAADLNQDGQVSTASVMETNGDILLVSDGGHYKAVASNGSAVTLTYGGQPVGPDSFSGWDAIQVEESASGGFEFLWAYEGGSYGWWKTDANGAYESSMLIAEDAVDPYEGVFEVDLDRDGSIALGFDGGDELLL